MTLPPLFEAMTQVQQWVQAHPVTAAAAVGGTFAGLAGVRVVGERLLWGGPASPLDTHGTARWATPREIRQAGFTATRGFVLGRSRGRVLHDNGSGHILLCGPTASGGTRHPGKDRSHLFPSTVASGQVPTGEAVSLIIHDPKQLENWRLCGAARRGPAGEWPVYLFHPTSRASCGLNILDTVRLGHPEEFADVSSILQSLFAVPRHVKDSTGARYYRLDEVTLLRGVTLLVLHASPRKNFNAVLAVMQDRKACLAAMKASGHPEVQRVGQWMADKPQSNQQSLWGGALQPLDLYHDPLIAQHTERSSFALRDLQYGATPLTLYLGAQTTGQVKNYLAPLYSVILQALLEYLKRQTDPHRRPLHWYLNEYPAFGYMEVLEAAPADVRDYRMRLVYVIQDLGQFFEVSGVNTSIWGNTATKIFHRPANDQTAERLAEMLGAATVEYTSASQQHRLGTWPSRGASTRRQERPLLDVAELLRLPLDEAVVVSTACDAPFRVHKVRLREAR